MSIEDQIADDDGMKTIRVPRDATVVTFTATAEAVVIKAADIAAANEAAALQAAQESKE